MAELTVYNRSGEDVGSYQIDPADVAPRINKQLLHDAVVMYQANQRLGSAKTKTRSEVAGSNKKLYRQKGTGNARAGSRRSGVRRGGGHIHAIRPRDYSYRLPRKALQLATRMAIASKIRDDEIVVIDDFALDRPHTQEMSLILKALGLSGTSTLVATEKHDNHVYLSGRNISQITISAIGDLNALLVLKPQKMLVTKAALDAIQKKAEEAKSQKSE
ncbi:MAG: 50S ribosomal protein L4 [Planctomycetaceae bacterium]|jgi:large subunit ribosomal protein L4|nr:50S ribosomal protein L4 [Planctomycetaceae bacterium]MBP60594.1 50S ribosomal protein L4 [Planctomycetaceae bacterium]